MAAKIVFNGSEVDNDNAGFLAINEDAVYELLRQNGVAFGRDDQEIVVKITARKARKSDQSDEDARDEADAPDAPVVTLDDGRNAERGVGKAAANADGDDVPSPEELKRRQADADAPGAKQRADNTKDAVQDRPKSRTSLAPRTAVAEAAADGRVGAQPAATQKAVKMEGPQGFAASDPTDAKGQTQQRVSADPTVKDVDAKAKKA